MLPSAPARRRRAWSFYISVWSEAGFGGAGGFACQGERSSPAHSLKENKLPCTILHNFICRTGRQDTMQYIENQSVITIKGFVPSPLGLSRPCTTNDGSGLLDSLGATEAESRPLIADRKTENRRGSRRFSGLVIQRPQSALACRHLATAAHSMYYKETEFVPPNLH